VIEVYLEKKSTNTIYIDVDICIYTLQKW